MNLNKIVYFQQTGYTWWVKYSYEEYRAWLRAKDPQGQRNVLNSYHIDDFIILEHYRRSRSHEPISHQHTVQLEELLDSMEQTWNKKYIMELDFSTFE